MSDLSARPEGMQRPVKEGRGREEAGEDDGRQGQKSETDHPSDERHGEGGVEKEEEEDNSAEEGNQEEEDTEEREEEEIAVEDRQRLLCILNRLLLLLAPLSSSTQQLSGGTSSAAGEREEESHKALSPGLPSSPSTAALIQDGEDRDAKKNSRSVPSSSSVEGKEVPDQAWKDRASIPVCGGVYVQGEEVFSNSFEAELCSLWDAAADVRHARFLMRHHLVDLLFLLLREFVLPGLLLTASATQNGDIDSLDLTEREEQEESLNGRSTEEKRADVPSVSFSSSSSSSLSSSSSSCPLPSSSSLSSSCSALRQALSVDRFGEIFCGCLGNLFSHPEVFYEALQQHLLSSRTSLSLLSSLSSSSPHQSEISSFSPDTEACRCFADLLLLSGDARTLREAFRALTSLLYNLQHLPPEVRSFLLRNTSARTASPASIAVSSSLFSSASSVRQKAVGEGVGIQHSEYAQARSLISKALFSVRYSLHSELIASACGFLETLLTVLLAFMQSEGLSLGCHSIPYSGTVRTPQFSGVHAPQVPGVHAPQVPGVHAPQVPGVHAPQVPGVHAPQVPGVYTPSEKGDLDEYTSRNVDGNKNDDDAEKEKSHEHHSEVEVVSDQTGGEEAVVFDRFLFPSIFAYHTAASDLVSLCRIEGTIQKVCEESSENSTEREKRKEETSEGSDDMELISSALWKAAEVLGVGTAPLVSPHRFHEVLYPVVQSEDTNGSGVGWTAGCTYTRKFSRKHLQHISAELRLCKEENRGDDEDFHGPCEEDLSMEDGGVLLHALLSLLDTALAYVQERRIAGGIETTNRGMSESATEKKNRMVRFLICLLQLSMRGLSVCTEDGSLRAALLLLLRVFLEARSLDASCETDVHTEEKSGEKETEVLPGSSGCHCDSRERELESFDSKMKRSNNDKKGSNNEPQGTHGNKKWLIEEETDQAPARRSSSSLQQEFEVYMHLFLRNGCGREVLEKLILLRQEEEVRSNPDALLGILFIAQFSSAESLKELRAELLEITQAHISIRARTDRRRSSSGVIGAHTPEERPQRKGNKQEASSGVEATEKEDEDSYEGYTMQEMLSDPFLKYLLGLCECPTL